MGFQNNHNVACIHGRFQPFHLGHANYLQTALRHWDNIVIGIAVPTTASLSFPGVEHRNRASANPLNYFERSILIRECCHDLGISDVHIEFAPFPIDEPLSLPFFIPKNIVCATTSLYAWNDEKIRRLENEGYTVRVLDECKKVPFDGSNIRTKILARDSTWTQLVTKSVADILHEWKIEERLSSLVANE